MRLLLVRHGESDANAAGIYQGWFDSPLSPRDDLRPVALYASPLARAWRTGEIIATALGLTPTPHPGLREINVGAATGLHFSAVRDRWPDLEARRHALGLDHGWPEGETGREFGARVAATLDEIIARHAHHAPADLPDDAIILATHGGTIRFALAYLRGDRADTWPIDPVGNCGISEIVIAPDGHRVVAINACAHLDE
jgi:broad specificity phosphatase PhoE